MHKQQNLIECLLNFKNFNINIVIFVSKALLIMDFSFFSVWVGSISHSLVCWHCFDYAKIPSVLPTVATVLSVLNIHTVFFKRQILTSYYYKTSFCTQTAWKCLGENTKNHSYICTYTCIWECEEHTTAKIYMKSKSGDNKLPGFKTY